MTLHLRDATPADYKDLAPLFQDVADLHGRIFGTRSITCVSPALTEEGLKARLERPDSKLLVAVEGQNIIGFVYADQAEDVATIRAIDVAPGFRGRNVAKTLISAIDDWAQAHYADVLQLRIYNANCDARKAYDRMGFQPKETTDEDDPMVTDIDSTVLIRPTCWRPALTPSG